MKMAPLGFELGLASELRFLCMHAEMSLRVIFCSYIMHYLNPLY